MRVLLDECLPRKLKRAFAGHEVKTVAESGWAGRKDGDLLGLMKALKLTKPKQLLAVAEAWGPWRAYAALHLWNHLYAGG